jgi:hypothetical protein
MWHATVPRWWFWWTLFVCECCPVGWNRYLLLLIVDVLSYKSPQGERGAARVFFFCIAQVCGAHRLCRGSGQRRYLPTCAVSLSLPLSVYVSRDDGHPSLGTACGGHPSSIKPLFPSPVFPTSVPPPLSCACFCCGDDITLISFYLLVTPPPLAVLYSSHNCKRQKEATAHLVHHAAARRVLTLG